MKLPSLDSLRSRLFLLVLVAILPALALTVYSGISQRSSATQDVEQDALRLSRLAVNSQQALIDSTRYLMTTLSLNPVVNDPSGSACDELLADLARQFTDYSLLAVANPDGAVTCTSVPMEEELDASDYSIFRTSLTARSFLTGDYIISENQNAFLPLAFPITGPDGQTDQVLFAVLNMTWLGAFFDGLHLPENSAMTLVDSNGTILARYPNPGQWVGQDMHDTEIIRAILTSNGEGTRTALGVDGIERLYAYTVLYRGPQMAVYIATGIPVEAAYGEVNRGLTTNLIVLGLVALVSLLGARLTGDIFFTQKVNTLVNTTRRLRSGDLASRTGLPYGNGELDQLAEAIDRMAATLEQRQAQIRQAEVRYRTLVEQLPAVTYTSSLGGNAHNLYISPQVEKILGYSSQEWLADPRCWLDHVHEEDRPLVEREIARYQERHGAFRSEYRFVHRNGHIVWIRDEANLVYDGDRPLFLQGLMVDVTEAKRAESSLRQYATQLEHSNRELQDFAYITSHDLQEPLRKIQAFGERLDSRYNSTLDERGRFYISRMVDSAARMQQLINDLLTYSRVSTRIRPFTPIQLNIVVQDAIATLEKRVQMSGGRIEVSALPVAEVDPVQMRQVFQNLIDNALKFRRPDIAPVVRIYANLLPPDTSERGKMVQLFIEDNGIGFEEKYLDRIFLPFQRLHGRSEYEGSGIGLAICRKIILRHNGELTASSTPGKGATFKITIPIKQASMEGMRESVWENNEGSP